MLNRGVIRRNLPQKELRKFSRRRRSIFYLKADIDVPDDVLSSLRNRKMEDTSINDFHITEICKHVFNELPLATVSLSDSGTFHSLYRIIFPNGRSYVLRVNVLSHLYRGFYFYIDEWVVEALKQKGLPSLEIYFVDLSQKLCPFDYQIVEEAKGEPLNMMEMDEEFDKKFIFELGRTIAGLHTIVTESFGLLDVSCVMKEQKGKGLIDSWEEYIFLNLDKHIKTCYEIGAITLGEGRIIETVFKHAHPLLENVTSSLLHGDLGNHNVFSDGRCITGIIDWEDCMSGDSIFDIAYWGTFYANDTDKRHQLFINGYKSLRQLPKDFELRYWLYYLRVALAKTVHRYRFKYPDRPGSLPSSRRIQKGLRKVEPLI